MAGPIRLLSPRAAGLVLGGSATAAAYYSYDRYRLNGRSALSTEKSRTFSIASVGETKGSPWSSVGFTSITLEESHMVNHNVKYLSFRLPEGHESASISPITSMLSFHKPSNAWIPVIRPYTALSTSEPGHLSFLVKRYPNGKGSGHLHSLKPGDTLSVKPLHEFDYKPNQYSHLTLLAGGAGTTPFIQLVRSIMSDPADQTQIQLVLANNSGDDILMKDEFDRYAKESPKRFGVKYVVSEGGECPQGVVTGRITKAIVEAALPAKADWSNSKVLICGPDGMVEAVAGKKGFGFAQGSLGGYLRDLGVDKNMVHKF